MIEVRADRKIGRVLKQLRDAETHLAGELRKVADRHAVEHEVYFGGHTLARQCEARATRLAALAKPYGSELAGGDEEPGGLEDLLASVRFRMSEAAGRQRVTGLLLLHDLRHLYLQAMQVDFYWTLTGQVAQAVRDHALLEASLGMHEQATTAAKWILTQTKVQAPAVLTVPD